ncbi:MAG TPA: methyltransferase domain-containing protein [Flavitalea sp.]|nr:methyltransferase domain-containing protein [Flavitalea sp.]
MYGRNERHVLKDTWFREWFDSPFYHKLYFQRDEAEAAAFLERLVGLLRPPPGSSMLDVACGRGRHSMILASKGFDITGIDLSMASIQEAKSAEHDKLHFYQHDMRLPFWINYFDYAFNFFTSFGYFKSEREHYNVIRTIADSLKQDGTLLLDYLNVHYAEEHLLPNEKKEMDGTIFYLTRWFDETHFYKKIEIEDDSLEAPLIFMEKVAKFNLGDFNDMFSYHHLQVQEIFGNYNFHNYHLYDSPRLIIVAKKMHF